MRFALCNEQQHSQKTGIFYGYGVAETPPVFQAGWSSRICFNSVTLYFSFLC
jgi:hypothetical protein